MSPDHSHSCSVNGKTMVPGPAYWGMQFLINLTSPPDMSMIPISGSLLTIERRGMAWTTLLAETLNAKSHTEYVLDQIRGIEQVIARQIIGISLKRLKDAGKILFNHTL